MEANILCYDDSYIAFILKYKSNTRKSITYQYLQITPNRASLASNGRPREGSGNINTFPIHQYGQWEAVEQIEGFDADTPSPPIWSDRTAHILATDT